jgi:hypothetical protein
MKTTTRTHTDAQPSFNPAPVDPDGKRQAALDLNANRTELARLSYLAACTACGTDPIAAEQMVLGVGREFLPPAARGVLDGGEATAEYYYWLENEVVAGAEEGVP